MEHSNYVAAVKDVEIKPSRVACALSIRQVSNDAVMRDARNMSSMEECVSSRQYSNVAAMKGAKMAPSMMECALDTGQGSNDAAVMGAQTMP